MKVIEAAGGVIVDLTRGKPRYLLIHRYRYDDWTLAKGKLDPGERHVDAAMREVKEETGFDCEVLTRLSTSQYKIDGGIKKVRWWLMTPVGGHFEPNEEVDAVTWLKRSQAMVLLSYVHDQALLVEAHLRVKELSSDAKAAARAAASKAAADVMKSGLSPRL